MSDVIKLKRRRAGAVGAPSVLASGEVAVNEQEMTVYYGMGDDGSGNATSILPFAGKGKFMDLASDQTIAGVKSFSALPSIPTLPVNPGDAAAKAYVDSSIANGAVVSFNGRSGPVSLVAADIPAITSDKITDFSVKVQTIRLDQLTAPITSVSFNGQSLTNLAAPVASTDAVNKAYVDALMEGLSTKNSVRVASSANISLATPGATIDGVTMASGNRVLLMGQSNGAQNGIYIWTGASAALTRSIDANTSQELLGAFVFVEEGTTNANAGFTMITDGAITLETTPMSWTQFSSSGAVSVDATLQKTGNQIGVNPNYPGQSSINTLGTVTTGVWQGTAIAVINGGTGATDAATARTNLGLGSMAVQNANAVAITGGTIDNVIIDGGTF